MADRNRSEQDIEDTQRARKETAVDAIRHVGPTLEEEGTFLPSGELPENRIEAEGMTEAGDVRAAIDDPYDREAAAMGAERLRTRLPGDTSSDPHTDAVADNPTAMNTEKGSRGEKGSKGRKSAA
jgi:hypothetical protein